MATLYVDTGGATTNSGSTDSNSASLSGSAATNADEVISLDGSPDLSGIITSGSTQSSIYLAQATNANKKIFWITAFDNVLKTVTIDVVPSGIVSSGWAIGGRFYLGGTGSPANASIEGSVRPGDTVIFNNSPSAQAASIWIFRLSGTEAAGRAIIQGKTGVRPVFNTTNTSACITFAAAITNYRIENIEVNQDGASGSGIGCGTGVSLMNIKVSDTGGVGALLGANCKIIASEISGTGSDGIQNGSGSASVFGNYVHDVSQSGIEVPTNTDIAILFNIFDTCAARGIYISYSLAVASQLATIANNTIYGCGDSGLEVVDASVNGVLYNNIFQDNGDAAGEYNVEWVGGTAEFFTIHGNNCFYKSSNNLLNITANSTEITTDPLFISPASGNFTLSKQSPCKGTGFPGTLLGGSIGYLDMGAIQLAPTGIPYIIGG